LRRERWLDPSLQRKGGKQETSGKYSPYKKKGERDHLFRESSPRKEDEPILFQRGKEFVYLLLSKDRKKAPRKGGRPAYIKKCVALRARKRGYHTRKYAGGVQASFGRKGTWILRKGGLLGIGGGGGEKEELL